jgi:hypothetical protein
MFPIASLTVFLVLAVSVAANPIVVRNLISLRSTPQHHWRAGCRPKDQARAENLVFLSKASSASPDAVVSVGAANVGVVYQASIGVGTHPQSVSDEADEASNMTYSRRLVFRQSPH